MQGYNESYDRYHNMKIRVGDVYAQAQGYYKRDTAKKYKDVGLRWIFPSGVVGDEIVVENDDFIQITEIEAIGW